MSPKEKIEETIQKFFHSMDVQDFELMKEVTAQKEDVVHIGTDSEEIWRGWSELNKATKEQFENLKFYKSNIRELSIHISDSGSVAWYSHLLDAKIKSDTTVQTWKGARFTGVLENIDRQWQIVQTHVSIPESYHTKT
ncbi:nuclear transport factor 2 family protein [Rhodohalobacter sulfatireducens]|uniref:Nuclear transport factor 2 family protein n=1 Tax=Rhodohalobacter sulfatireducens TaxID=2911366 RepID=A0ABS9KG79_9BACT|nr:nuclear transport factor 2 family protein [Rhodohalobacter sulfatireducens]MCG2589868.1 nuclear transport factor 2 family protein [Rhodohalobacter sulfatireducens]